MILRNGKNTDEVGCGLTIFKWYMMHCNQFSHIVYETPDERMVPFCDPHAGDFYEFEVPPPEEFNKHRHIYVRTNIGRYIFRQPFSGEATFLCDAITYESMPAFQSLDDHNKRQLHLPLEYTERGGSRYYKYNHPEGLKRKKPIVVSLIK